MMIARRHCQTFTASLLAALCLTTVVWAQTTAFTYQGKLTDAGTPATGNYDLQFRLFDALAGGTQVGSTLIREDVAVTGGIFTVPLDFGAAAFPGANRWLEIGVRPGVSTGAFTALNPLQPVTSTPYAVQSLNATNALQLGGTAASQYVLTGDARLTNARAPTAGSTNYIQNTATLQAASNFNISGNGFIGGKVSIGTTALLSLVRLYVLNDETAIYGSSNGNVGVYGQSISGDGVFGSSSSQSGVVGSTGAAHTTTQAGVYGASSGDGGIGVFGEANFGNAWGVYGKSTGGEAGHFEGKVVVTGCISATNISCASDARLKQKVTPLSYGLREVLRLRPVRWQWKDTTNVQLNLGLIAQEVEPVMPELVLREADPAKPLGLNYLGLVPVVIKAIQEQQGAITTLKAENTTLRQQNATLEARLTALEQIWQELKGQREQNNQAAAPAARPNHR